MVTWPKCDFSKGWFSLATESESVSENRKLDVVSGVISATESESEESERFHFFRLRLRLRRFTFRLWSSEDLGARSIQPKFPEISVQNSMDRFGPTGKVSKKQVHLLRWSSFPGRTGLNFGWMDRALDCRSRKKKRKDKPITIHVVTLCDWLSSSASASDHDNLVFTRS